LLHIARPDDGAIALRNLVEWEDEIEDFARVDLPFPDDLN